MSPQEFGRATEARFIMEATARGMLVSTPFTEAPGYDAIVDCGGVLTRVQVKGCRALHRPSRPGMRWIINTSGGNSWDVLAAYFLERDTWALLTRGQIPEDRTTVTLTPGGRLLNESRSWDLFSA